MNFYLIQFQHNSSQINKKLCIKLKLMNLTLRKLRLFKRKHQKLKVQMIFNYQAYANLSKKKILCCILSPAKKLLKNGLIIHGINQCNNKQRDPQAKIYWYTNIISKTIVGSSNTKWYLSLIIKHFWDRFLSHLRVMEKEKRRLMLNLCLF